MRIDIPIKTISESNAREHYYVKARRVKRQRDAAYMCVRSKMVDWRSEAPCETVRIVRIAPRPLDTDNLQGALKAIRDGVSDALGIDDAPGLLEWEYGQQKGNPKEYAVRVVLK